MVLGLVGLIILIVAILAECSGEIEDNIPKIMFLVACICILGPYVATNKIIDKYIVEKNDTISTEIKNLVLINDNYLDGNTVYVNDGDNITSIILDMDNTAMHESEDAYVVIYHHNIGNDISPYFETLLTYGIRKTYESYEIYLPID